jgi:hypothetical protein
MAGGNFRTVLLLANTVSKNIGFQARRRDNLKVCQWVLPTTSYRGWEITNFQWSSTVYIKVIFSTVVK